MNEQRLTDSRLNRTATIALLVGAVAAALCVLGWMTTPTQFFRSYLFGYLLWWEIGVGSLGLAMLFHLTGGAWGRAARPYFESGARTLPILAVLFVPIGLGVEHIYPWADESWLAEHELNPNRRWYLEESFYITRAAVYFLMWFVLAFVLTAGRPPKRADAKHAHASVGVAPHGRANGGLAQASPPGLVAFSGLGLVLLVFTVTFSGVDWVMSLVPHYKSTIFGGILVAGTGISAMAAVAAAVALTPRQATIESQKKPQVLGDLGNLMLAFMMVWMYVMFSQYLITWSGNLPEEAMWYIARQNNGWGLVAVGIVVLHFVLPFLLLLSRDVKRSPRGLASVAMLLLAAHALNNYWLMAPSWRESLLDVHWLDVVTLVAVGGLWTAEYVRNLKPRVRHLVDAQSSAPEANA